MWKHILFFLFLITLITGGSLWYLRWQHKNPTPIVVEQKPVSLPEPVRKEEVLPPVTVVPKHITKTFEYAVPFTSQAPTGDWSKSTFQDGCEEASTLMVWMARTGQKLTPVLVKEKLIDMALFEHQKIGHGVDTDAEDTNRYLLNEYFGISDSRVKTDVTLETLKEALLEGLLIIPTNGRALKNPNFTAPGPLEHMLVIKGYDVATREFITNDPGTRKGEGYRYPEQVLYDAIQEYPTGKHLPITGTKKTMIVIPFESQS